MIDPPLRNSGYTLVRGNVADYNVHALTAACRKICGLVDHDEADGVAP